MSPRVEIRTPRGPDEALAFGWVVFRSLVGLAQPHLDHVEAFVERTGADRMRVAVSSGEVLGGLVLLDMGQFFGGRSVPMTGVSAVAVAPQHRGGGVARALMRSALAELSQRRVALSGLYPATQPVYRRHGYEIAGLRQQWRVPTRLLALGSRQSQVRSMRDEDRAALHSCYHAWASRRAGLLDRIDWGWRRVLESPDSHVDAHVVPGPRGRGMEGYVVTTRQPLPGMRSEIHVRDLVALTPRALQRLLTFLGDHRSIAPSALLWLGPGDALQFLPQEQERVLEAEWRWMTRVVDLEAAVAARGFPPGIAAEIAIEVEDEDLRRNRGGFVLACAGGRGLLRRARTAAPAVMLHARALGPLFTGHASPHELAAAGLASGSFDALSVLGALFAGPAPWTPDMW